jgi:hypothetical protein
MAAGRRPHISRRAIFIALAALIAAVNGGPGQGAPRQMRAISRLVIRGLDALTPVGAPNGDGVIRIGVGLERPNVAAEDRLLAAMYDPASQHYHQFMNSDEFAAVFGVPRSTFERARAWLASGRLKILFSSTSRDYVIASGSVRDVERLFGVKLREYRYRGQAFVANDRAPQVPADLPITSVVGLDSRAKHVPMRSAGRPNATDIGNRTPQDLWSVYEMPAGVVGRGVSVGIIGVGDTNGPMTSLKQFETSNHLRHVPVQVVRTPATGDYSDTSVAGEWNLDVAAVSGMANWIDKEVLYSSPTYADTDLIGSLANWVGDKNGPPIMNESFGECEESPLNPVLTNPALATIDGNEHPNGSIPQLGLPNSSHPAEDQILKQAVMMGRTLFASAGDAGAGCGAVYFPLIGAGNGAAFQINGLTEDPSSNPYVVGVGGTVLYTDGGDPPQRDTEYAWTHSGGNASPFITAPDYQHDVPNLVRPCLMDVSGSPSNTGEICRGVPDVAALSGDIISNGYAGSGGTSLSSPLWAGMWARVMSASPAGRTLGFANEAIYRIAKDPAKYANAFYDVTVGTNGNPALPGWDYVTGWGVPRVSGLITELLGVTPSNIDPGATPPGGSTGSTACTVAFEDPVGDPANMLVLSGDITSSSDITNGYLRYDPVTKATTFIITVKDLQLKVPSTYTTMSWTANLTVPDGTIYFLRALVDLTGATAFEYGEFVPNPTGLVLTGASLYLGTTTGKFVEGANGQIQIVVPAELAPAGTKLTDLYATSGQGRTLPASAPGNVTRGLSQILDTAPDTGADANVSWTVAPCGAQASSTPPAPAPKPKPTPQVKGTKQHPAPLANTGVGYGLAGLWLLTAAGVVTAGRLWRRSRKGALDRR